MDLPESESSSAPQPRLDSWKEIASYLGRGVRTVQRWERVEGLPVRRHQHDKRGTVFALPSEIDEWLRAREESGISDEPSAGEKRSRPELGLRVAGASALALVCVFAAGYSLSSIGDPAVDDWTIRPLTADRGLEYDPVFSPDGAQVAYSWSSDDTEEPHIYIQPVAGGPRRRLTQDNRLELSPAWSPDGRFVAAAVQQADGTKAVVLISPETGVQRSVFESFSAIPSRMFAWSPDARWLLAAITLDDRAPGIYAYRIEDGASHAVLPPSDRHTVWTIGLSPDGGRIAFGAWTTDSVSELFVVDVDSYFQPLGEPRALTDEGGKASHPVFTTDGSEVIYRAGWHGSGGLSRVSVDGGEPRGIAVVAAGADSFDYHPANELLVFSRIRHSVDIWRQPLCACPERRSRVVESTLHDLNARASPDGRRIAFASDRSGAFQIWVTDVDGANPRQLTHYEDTMTGTPRWSPDSRLIAFDSRVDGQAEIFIVDADGGEPQQLTEHPAADVTPSWSADGRWVYFGSDRSGEFQVWKAPASGGEVQQVTRDGGFTAAESPDGETLYVARRGSRDGGGGDTSLWRMPAIGGPAMKIAESIGTWSRFVPTRDGVVYLTCERDEPCTVWLHRLGEPDAESIGTTPSGLDIGFDVVENGAAILYSAVEAGEGDLMLVEGFR